MKNLSGEYMQRLWTSLALVSKCAIPIIILVITSSCSEQESIRIAFLGASAGKHSEVVVSVRNSVQLYIDEINKMGGVGGRKIQLDSFDNKLDVSRCGELFDQIIREGYKFVIGPVFSQMAEVTLEKINGQNILVISPTMSAHSLKEKDDNFLRVCLTNTGQSKAIAAHILARGYKKLAVVSDKSNAKYTEPLIKETWKIVKENGVQLVKTVSYQNKDTLDMYSLAQDIYQAKPDVVLFCTSAIDAANLAQQLRKVDDTIKFVGSSWSQTNDLIEQGGRSVDGMVLIAIHQEDKTNDRYRLFETKFSNRYGHAPSFPTILGHNATDVLIKGIQNAPEMTPGSVKKTILSQRIFTGLTAPIIFDKYGDVEGGYSLVEVKNGHFTTLQQ